ncbi:sensor histidine kinase [Emticicia sp. BO119]|uniref:sensor histidine kinase n=1 Tax=Emticicia sp. BO119 TaxID=2757768 RepID=UPI0015F08DBB|nr:sensor histidine kinase [Emticicia sp. BO119]MBA4850558.1 sensor histidine kinase [Emticicia sp. BO119]
MKQAYLTFQILLITLVIIMDCRGQKPIEIGANFKYEELNPVIQIMTDSSNTVNEKNLEEYRSHFQSYHKNYPTGNYFHWITFLLKNTQEKSINLRIAYQNYADSISVFMETKTGFKSIDSPQSWLIPNAKKIYPSVRFSVFSFTLDSREQRKVYIKLLKKDGVVLSLPLVLYERLAFEKHYSEDEVFHGFYFGWMAFVSILSFVFYPFLRERVYLFYSLSILFSVLNLMAQHGILNLYYDWLPVLIKGPSAILLFSHLYYGTTILFSQLYLESDKYCPKIWQYFVNCYLVSILIFLSLLIFNHNLNYWTYGLWSTLVYVLIAIGYLIYGLIQKRMAAFYYVIAILPMFSIGCLYIFSSLGFATFSLELAKLYKLSVLFEIFVLSIGLGHRYLLFRKEKKKLELALIQSQHKIIESQETERQRLAKDLHDELGGTLSAIKGRMANEEVRPETITLIEKAIEDLRSVSRNLMPPELANEGLVHAVYYTIERIQSSSPIEFTFISFGKEQRLNQDSELNIYRVISELVNNVLKHSQATKAIIQLIYYETYLSISVEDNGIGIKTNQNNWGIGLKNIHSRVEFLRAKLNIDSGSKGTTVIIEVPIKDSHANT